VITAFICDLITCMRQAALATPRPATPEALKQAAIERLRGSGLPHARHYIGPNSKVHATLDLLAACVLDGKTFAERHPDAAKATAPVDLAAFDQALVAPL